MSDVESMGVLPLTKDAVYQTARLWGGTVHGDDAAGVVDIEFPNVVDAAGYAQQWAEVTTVTLREPVTAFDVPVVVQLQLRNGVKRCPVCSATTEAPRGSVWQVCPRCE